MFVRAYAGAVVGIDAVTVTVEVNITGGGLGLYLVGLPDNAVKESEQRIRAAFENSGERMSGRKVVVSLAPADLRKEGSGFDLPLAVGILAAMERIDAGALEGTMFAGELSLDGSLKPVRGVLPLAILARRAGFRRLVVPAENAAEGAVLAGLEDEPLYAELYGAVAQLFKTYGASEDALVRYDEIADRASGLRGRGLASLLSNQKEIPRLH